MNKPLEDYLSLARDKIKQHAARAIDVLQEQLLTAKSPAKIAKLNVRIADWKHSLEILESSNGKEETGS